MKFNVKTEARKSLIVTPMKAFVQIPLYLLVGYYLKSDGGQSCKAQPDNHVRPYSIAEATAVIGVSTRRATLLCDKAMGVVVIASPEKLPKRSYRTIWIPRSLFERAVRRLTR